MVFWCHFRVPYKQHPALADSSIADPITKTSYISRCWFDVLAACNCCLFHFPKANVLEKKKLIIPVPNFLTRNNEVHIRLCTIVLYKGEHLSAGKFIQSYSNCYFIVQNGEHHHHYHHHHYTICPSSTFFFLSTSSHPENRGKVHCHTINFSFSFSLPLIKFSMWLERLYAKEYNISLSAASSKVAFSNSLHRIYSGSHP